MPTYIPYDEEAAPAQPSTKFVPYDGPVVTTGDAAPAKRNFTQELLHQAGRTARMAATGATGVGGAIADFGFGAANLAGAGLQGPPPSQQFQQALTKLGLPEDVTPIEKATGFVGSMAAGGLDPASAAIQGAVAARGAPAAFQTATDQARLTAQELRRAGVKVPPSLARDNATLRAIEGFGGSGKIEQSMRFPNQERFQELARRANDIPTTSPVTRDVLVSRAHQIAEQGYRPVEAIPSISIGGRMRSQLREIQRDLGTNQSFPLAQRDSVLREVRSFYVDDQGRVLQQFSGRDAIANIKRLRQEADDLFNMEGGDKMLAAAKERIAKVLEDQIEFNLNNRGATGSELLRNFRAARVDLAKNYATRKMLSDPTNGIIDPIKAASIHASGAPLTGELRTIAQAGSPVFRRATAVPTGGKPPELSPWDFTLMTAGGAGAYAGHPTGAAVAALPFARAGARKFVESNAAQRFAAQGLIPPDVKGRMAAQGAAQFAPYMNLFDPYTNP